MELPTYILLLAFYLNAYIPLKELKSFFNSSTVDFSWRFVYVLRGFGPTGRLTSNLSSSASSSEGGEVFVEKVATHTNEYVITKVYYKALFQNYIIYMGLV